MRTSTGFVVSLLALAACSSSSEQTVAAPAVDPSAAAAAPVIPWPTVIEVDRVEVLQGTTTLLVEEAAPKKKQNAPIIVGRPGFVRVHARLTASTKANAIASELVVSIPGQADQTFTDTPKRLTEYDASDLDSTFDFDLPEAAFAKGASYKLTLKDSKDASLVYEHPTAFDFAAQDAPVLRVQFIPIKYESDGSGRLPTLDAKTVEAYRQSLYKLYPSSKVEVSVHNQLDWGNLVEGDGTGWDQLLSAVMTTRRHDPVADDVYYVGVFEPADSLTTYCKQGCVLGVAPAPGGLAEIGMRSALITGYGSDGRNGTLAQELAHAMGRLHAPCGNAQFIDDDYPYDGAHLGVPGFDIVDKKVYDPGSRVYDFMSYCGPIWTSDYTYKAIFDRMVEVKAALRTDPGTTELAPRHTEQSWLVDGKGAITKGPEVTVLDGAAAKRDFTPGLRVHFQDAAGTTLGSSAGVFHPYDNIPGGILVAPDAPARTTKVRAEGLALPALRANVR